MYIINYTVFLSSGVAFNQIDSISDDISVNNVSNVHNLSSYVEERTEGTD